MIEIKDLKKVKLNKDDVLVIQIPHVPIRFKEGHKKMIKKFFPDNEILYITDNIKMYIVEKEELKKD